MDDSRNIAIVTARAGSKGLPDKNIKLLLDRPLMAYSIEAALKSDIFDEVMVSTDSEEYADIAIEYGAHVPFLRSEENSGDSAGSWDTVREVLSRYEEKGEVYDSICLLQPTSPLRTEIDLREAYKLFFEKKADAIIGVCEAEHTPLWMNTLPDDGSMEEFIPKQLQGKNRQALDKYYRINGAIYISKVSSVMEKKSIYENCYAYVMPAERSVDIDSELDFVIAESILKI